MGVDSLRVRGGSRIRLVDAEEDQVQFQPAEESVRIHPQLPLQPNVLLGREQEMSLLHRCLIEDDMRLLTITGPPGMGKTRLAVEAAIVMQDAFPDGARLIALGEIDDPGEVPSVMARALDLQESSDRSTIDQIMHYLARRTMLLVLDSCERVVDAAAGLVQIVTQCPGITLLLTSQEPLRVRWEHILSLNSLPVPDLPPRPSLTDVMCEPAVLLFAQRARAIRLDFAVTDENAADVAAICARLDGLPLAIELAAARTNLLPPATIRAMLETDRQILRNAGPDLPPRHRSLQAALAWGYQHLPDRDQELIRQLSVFVAGFRPEAALQVAGWPERGLDVLDGLGSLAEKSLLVIEPVAKGGQRFRLVETFHRIGLAESDVRGELRTLRQRHAAYYVHLAEQCGGDATGPNQRAAFDQLEEEHENVIAALVWAREEGDAETALRLVRDLAPFWWARGHLSEGITCLQETLASFGQADPRLRTRAMVALSALLRWRGTYDLAVDIAEEALGLARTTDDPGIVAWALTILGAALTAQGRLEEAQRRLSTALEHWQQIGGTWGIGLTLRWRAVCAIEERELHLAETFCADSISIFMSLGDNHNLALTSLVQADIAAQRGDVREAASALDRYLQLVEDLGEYRLAHLATERIVSLVTGHHMAKQMAHLLGAAEAFRALTGFAPSPNERRIARTAVATSQIHPDTPALDVTRQEGRDMPIEAIVAEAHEVLRALQPTPAVRKASRSDLLSKREHEVLDLVAKGEPNKGIAKELFISENTVKYHVTSLLNKLGASSRGQIVALAIQRHLL